MPSLVVELGAATRDLQWIVDSYNLVFATFVLASGSLSDRYGRKGAVLVGLLVFGGAAIGAAQAGTPDALFGFVFLMTQYFQFVRDYSPLATGLRILPVATCVAIGSVAGILLAVRIGNKIVVTAGLLSLTGAFLWISTVDASTSYLMLALQMLPLGLGVAPAATPATEATRPGSGRRPTTPPACSAARSASR